MAHDLIIVGGGPAGSMVAEITAPHIDVVILEEHRKVGSPVQCTGLVTPRVVKRVNAEETVLNELRGAVIHFPGGEEVEVISNEIKAMVIDRESFDEICHRRAVDAGASFLPGHKFQDLLMKDDHIKISVKADCTKTMKSKMIVGADGYKSNVARKAGLGGAKEAVRGFQVDIEYSMESQESVHVFLGNNVAPGFFAWQIPCGNFTRVGLCVSEGNGSPSRYLKHLMKRLNLEGRVLRKYGGFIPLGVIPRTFTDRVMIVGDAAAQIKPLSGGGLFTGMRSAECAGITAVEAAIEENFSSSFLSKYEERWHSAIGKEIERGYLLRKVFIRLNDKKLDQVSRIIKKHGVSQLLSEGDIDRPTELVPLILRSAPSLIRFSPQILSSLLLK